MTILVFIIVFYDILLYTVFKNEETILFEAYYGDMTMFNIITNFEEYMREHFCFV